MGSGRCPRGSCGRRVRLRREAKRTRRRGSRQRARRAGAPHCEQQAPTRPGTDQPAARAAREEFEPVGSSSMTTTFVRVPFMLLPVAASAARGQDVKIPANIEKLTAKAVETVNVTVDGAL